MVHQAREQDKTRRRRRVLESIVRLHTSTAEPVSSQAIAREMGLSSATIRNIMYGLEEEGLIRQPHTSAGRVPTDTGYRLYVDSLIEHGHLREIGKRYMDEMVASLRANSIEDVLLKSLQLCSRVTSQACVAFFPAIKIKRYLIERLEEEIKNTLTSWYEFADRLYLDGTHYLAEQPEFRSVDKLRLVLRMLEDKKILLEMLEESVSNDGLSVNIGSENSAPGFEECTLVVANYRIDGDIAGTLGIIGPMRMDYHRVIPAVSGIADSISSLFRDMI
jgi:heat-inducible transcriptional repressor